MKTKRTTLISSLKWKPVLFALPVVCVASLTGCQWTPFGMTQNAEGVGKEKLITDAVTKMSSARSMDADIDAKMTATAQMSGVKLGVNAVTGLNVQSAKADNASHAKGNVTFELIGEKGSLDIETYSLDKDNIRYTYIKQSDLLTGDTGWIVAKDSKETAGQKNAGADVEAFSRLNLGNLLGLYNSAKDSMAGLSLKDGTQKIEGKECYVVEGSLKGEDVKALTDGLGFDIPGIPGLPKPDLAGVDADIKMYFEEASGDPYIIELKIPEVKGVSETNPLTFGIDNIDATIKFNSFNANDEIKVPEEVEKGAIVSVDSQSVLDMLNAK